ncbi:MAG: site-specific integrase [Pseudomonadota bacterium]
MAEHLNFTVGSLNALKARPKRYYVYDTKIPHLALCVTPSGTRTFYLYRRIHGQPERLKLGRFPAMTIDQARKQAERTNGTIAAGLSPAETRRALRGELTVQALYERYRVEHLEARGQHSRATVSIFENHLKPWARRKLSTIRRAHVIKRHAELGRTAGPIMANRAVERLRAMYNWAIRMELFSGDNPAVGIEKFKEVARERFLQPDEVPRFIAAVEASEPDFRDFVLLCLFTGARSSNVRAMAWRDVFLERATWTIPDTKNGEPYTVPLVSEAMTILERRQNRTASEWVFPGPGQTGHFVEHKRAWGTLLKRAKIENLHLHDLRRTLGSYQAATGASQLVIQKSLGHKSLAATSVYTRLNLDPVRESVNAGVDALLKHR